MGRSEAGIFRNSAGYVAPKGYRNASVPGTRDLCDAKLHNDALLDAARDHARATGAIRLSLATQKTNAAAKALYESRGWVKDEAFEHYSLAT